MSQEAMRRRAKELASGPKRNAAAIRSLGQPVTLELVHQLADGSVVPTGAGKSHVVERAVHLVSRLAQFESMGVVGQIQVLFSDEMADKEPDPEKKQWSTTFSRCVQRQWELPKARMSPP